MLPTEGLAPDYPGAWAVAGRHPAPRMEAQRREQRDAGPPGVKPLPDGSGKARMDHAARHPVPDKNAKTQPGRGQRCPGHWTGRARREQDRASPAWPRETQEWGLPKADAACSLGPVTG